MSIEEATGQAGVSAEDQAGAGAATEAAAEAQQRQLSPREAQMASVRQQYNEQVEADRKAAVEQGILVVDKPEAAVGAGKEEEKLEAEHPASLPPNVVLQDGKMMVKLKVAGQEKLVAIDNVIATAQKHESADIRLQEAGRQLRDAQALHRKVAEQAQELGKKQPSTQVDADGGDFEAKTKEIAKEMESGDITKAVRMLAELGRQHATLAEQKQTVTLDDVESVIARREDLGKKREAVNQYMVKHKDLAENPVLNRMVDEQSAILLNDESNAGRPYTEILDEAARLTREAIGKVAPKQSAEPRTHRKESVSMPGPGNNARRPAPVPPQPKTREQIVAEMRSARGR